VTYSAFNDPTLAFDTQQLHAGYDPSQHLGAKTVPIYQTAVFELGDFERCERLFSYEEEGDSYVRFSNPTKPGCRESDRCPGRRGSPADDGVRDGRDLEHFPQPCARRRPHRRGQDALRRINLAAGRCVARLWDLHRLDQGPRRPRRVP
jgi:hypothetical protein